MSLNEAGTVLGNRCILAFKPEHDLFKLLEEKHIKVPAYINLDEDTAHIHLYIEDDTPGMFDESQMKELGCIKVDDTYIFREKMNDSIINGIVSQLIKEPLVITNSFYLSEGWIVMDLRFHGSRYRRVSSILGSSFGTSTQVKLLYLGTSPGIIPILSKLNEEIPLSVIIFESEMLDTTGTTTLFSKNPDLLEIENSIINHGRVKVISYKREPGSATYDVSEEYVENTLLKGVRDEAHEESIIRYGIYMKRYGDFMRTMVVMPTNQVNQYLNKVFMVARNLGVSTVSLIAAAPFDFEVLEMFS